MCMFSYCSVTISSCSLLVGLCAMCAEGIKFNPCSLYPASQAHCYERPWRSGPGSKYLLTLDLSGDGSGPPMRKSPAPTEPYNRDHLLAHCYTNTASMLKSRLSTFLQRQRLSSSENVDISPSSYDRRRCKNWNQGGKVPWSGKISRDDGNQDSQTQIDWVLSLQLNFGSRKPNPINF